jgi:hypothetical protein
MGLKKRLFGKDFFAIGIRSKLFLKMKGRGLSLFLHDLKKLDLRVPA